MVAPVEVKEVRDASELAAVVRLLDGYLAWLREHYGEAGLGWIVERYYPPDKWAAMIGGLAQLHAPPRGEMLLATVAGRPASCTMMDSLEDGVCEMKRLFVPSAMRGRGIGRLLATRLIDIARDRGFHAMRLDTANPEAALLYRKLGFAEIQPYYECPEDLGRFLCFMEARLD